MVLVCLQYYYANKAWQITQNKECDRFINNPPLGWLDSSSVWIAPCRFGEEQWKNTGPVVNCRQSHTRTISIASDRAGKATNALDASLLETPTVTLAPAHEEQFQCSMDISWASTHDFPAESNLWDACPDRTHVPGCSASKTTTRKKTPLQMETC